MSDTSTDLKGEQPSAANFLFEVDGVQIGVFSQVSGLEVRVDVATYQEGGENGFTHNLPGRMSWPTSSCGEASPTATRCSPGSTRHRAGASPPTTTA